MEAGGSVGNSRDLPVARKASPSTKKNHKSRDHYNDSNREIDKEHLAKLLRASADIVEKGEFASVLYEALQDFRVYYKQNYPKNHKKKKHSSKHGQQSLVRENSGNSQLTAGSEKTNSESSEILKDLKHSEENAPKSAHAAHHVDTKEDAESDTLHGNKANASHDAESPEETGANPDKDDGDTAGANHSASRHEQMKPEVSAPFDEEKVAEKKQPSPEESETTEEDEKPGGTERASVASVVPPSPYFARKLAKPIQVEKKDTVPEHYVVASGAAAAASPTHQSNNRAFGKKFNLGATFKNVKKAAMNVTENISEKIPGKAHHHNKPAEDLGIFSESGIAMAESSGRRRSEGVGNDEFGNAEFQSRVTGGEAGVTASAGHNASEQKNDKNSYQQFSHEVGSKSAPPKPPLSRTGPALFESQRFVEQSPPKQFESTPEDRSGKSIGSHDCSESDGIRGGFETSPAVPDRIMELGGGGLMSKPSFQRPANKESALVANGWIEQFRRSKMRHVWKEVLASLVEGRKPGEVTTLWIQREVADPITGQKKLEALHRIPLKMLEDVSLTEHSTDNQFRLKLFNGTEDFVFRCSDAPIDAMRWVQMLKQHEQLAKGTIKNATNGYHKESNVPVQQQRSPTTKGMAIRDLRAICHGAGINTAGMERAQLEAAAAEVQSRGTYFDQRGAPTAPSPARYPTQQEKQQHQPSHYPQPVQADHSNDHARNAPASSAEYPQQQQEQQQAEPKRLAIKDLRAICHGAGINTAGMERRELEAAAREVESRGTYFPSTIAGTPAPSEEETRARQEEYRRQQLQQQEELRRRQESDAALKRHQQEVEESRRRAAEMEARRQEEARRRAMEEEQRRRAAEEEARRRAAADEARRRAAAEEQARRQREAHVAQERYAQQQAAWQQQQQAEQQRRHHAEQQAAQERRRREEAMRKEQQWAAAAPGAHPQQQWQQQHQQQYQAYSQQQQQHPPQQRWQQQQQQQQPHQRPPPQQQAPPRAPPPQQQQKQSLGADNKYAQMANQSEDDGQAAITKIKHSILISWALQPPQLQMLRPIAALVTTIHTVFPPALGVAGHDYFKKWKPIGREDVAGVNGLPEDSKLKKSVRKIRFFLHPDKLPHDLNEEQKFMVKMLWDVTNDSWEEYQKHKEDLDWVN